MGQTSFEEDGVQDIREQLGVAVRWLPLLLVGALLAGILAYLVTSSQPPVYQATARLLIDPGPDPAITDLQVAGETARNYVAWVKSRDVLARVATAAGLSDAPAELASRVTVESETGTAIFDVSAHAGSPEGALAIVEALGDQLFAVEATNSDPAITDEADRYVTELRAEILELQAQIDELRRSGTESRVKSGSCRISWRDARRPWL